MQVVRSMEQRQRLIFLHLHLVFLQRLLVCLQIHNNIFRFQRLILLEKVLQYKHGFIQQVYHPRQNIVFSVNVICTMSVYQLIFEIHELFRHLIQ